MPLSLPLYVRTYVRTYVHTYRRMYEATGCGKLILKVGGRWEVGLKNRWEVGLVGGGLSNLVEVGRLAPKNRWD